MNKTCDNCKYMARHSDLCCLKIADWKLRPESNTCDNWGANPLVQLGIDIERTRCAQVCGKLIEEYRGKLRAARECDHRDRMVEYSASIHALERAEKMIRGEG